MKYLATLLLAVPALVAAAAPQVQLESKVFAEVVNTVAGKQQITLKAPSTVLPGDKLIFETSFRNTGAAPATKVVLTNPVPAGITYSGDSSPGAQVSVDGGRSFGDLATLKVADVASGARPARHTDVTTIRWIVPAIAPGATGSLKYRGIVR